MSLHVKVGDSATIERVCSDETVRGFADLTGDRNPVHLDDEFAASTRFGRRIVHGMFLAGLISSVLGEELPGRGTVYLSQTLQFKAPAFVGDEVAVTAEVTRVREDKPIVTMRTTCRNRAGDLLVDGEAVLLVPKE